ncbi:unnamed protein product [Rhizophagus irregularis]|nr:unnamed protein product [Rhizophagus irregularis]
MAHPINALLSFYHVTEIGRQYWTGLKRITSSDSEFEASRREKAKEIINKWKEWTRSYSAFIGKDSTRMNMRVRTISSISQVNNLTGDSAQNFDNCRITSGKRDREETERASPRLNKKASQPQDLDEQLEADLGKFQPITNNEKLNQSKTRADSQKPANKAPTYYTNTVKGGKKINTEKEIFLELRS